MQNNPMNFLLQALQCNNPDAVLQNLAQNNPQAMILLNQARNSGMDYKTFVIQYAKQNNINIQPLLNMLGQNGIKL